MTISMTKPGDLFTVGETVAVRLPWSEVCMHMRVAGEIRPVLLKEHGAQILNEDGSNFSFPVTFGEAGFRANVDRTFQYIG
ncbi:hypothetical protein [Streptomyces sp. NBC_01751]|uniref:hypothetical protein n=1 Tax=Streptomyces sp. NBC_01751 TaxID=2975929 RepID=UPI002DD80125|nr:hypothetical protein [Streptomyces sp. NBC_01751]WSD24570.1 hypothetical protein OHA26_14345 [Streptomyces sp. NBC_01751]